MEKAPLRSPRSARFREAASTLTSSWDSPGTGRGTSSYLSTSSVGPKSWIRIAFMGTCLNVQLPLYLGSGQDFLGLKSLLSQGQIASGREIWVNGMAHHAAPLQVASLPFPLNVKPLGG